MYKEPMLQEPMLRMINELCKGGANGKYVFIIPTYQRGYRWTDHVTRLLDDLCEFYDFHKRKPSFNDFYCLQPIILRKVNSDDAQAYRNSGGESEYFEVIDGQQRLTTIKLILQCTNSNMNTNMYELWYERSKDELGTKLDRHYTDKARNRIEEWFDNNSHKEDLKDELSRILKNYTKIIWQEIPANDTEEALKRFININSRSISLSSSELVKAMLLNEKLYGKSCTKGLKLYRAGVWDEFTTYMGNKDFRSFIGEMNERDVPADYLVELEYRGAADNKNNNLRIEDISHYYEDKLLGINRITDNGDNPKEVFDGLRGHFRNFQDWFADPELYNYIGYLLNEKKSTPFEIDAQYRKSTDADGFKGWLASKVYSSIKNDCGDCDDDRIAELRYEEHYAAIMRVLKVFSVCMANKAHEYFGFRPAGGSSIEHIFAQNMDVKNPEKKLAYLRERMSLIDNIIQSLQDDHLRKDALLKLKNEINNCSSTDENKVNELFDSFLELAEHYGFNKNKDNIHSIGNLALIGKHLNSELSNKPFCEKREYLFADNSTDNRTRDDFPLAAYMVFNKIFTTTNKTHGPYNIDLTLWTNDDCEAYKAAIKKEIRKLKEAAGKWKQ